MQHRTTARLREFAVAILAAVILIACAAPMVYSKSGTTTTFVLTRHGDRDPKAELLNATGRERAQALMQTLRPMGITAIYSPDVRRNLDTARPLSEAIKVPITRTPATSYFAAGEIIADMLAKHSGGVILFVGNASGNLQEMFRRLHGSGDPPAEYGQLSILRVTDQGAVTTVHKRYGP